MNLRNWIEQIPKRYILSLLGFLGFFNGYILRSNLSIAIVAMVDPTIEKLSNNTTIIIPPAYNWTSVTQGIILSSFFYSYVVIQIPAGYLATRFGGKILFGGGIGLCGFVTFFTPLCAQSGSVALIILRLIEGFCSGFMYPSMHLLWTKWAPQQDKSKLITFTLAGSYVGLFVAMLLGGVIAQYWSWQWVFYLSGISAIIWTIIWFYFARESPSDHPTMSSEELTYIKKNLAPTISPKSKIPWKSILLSPPVWAIIFAHFATNWPVYTMLLELPTYLSQCLGYDLTLAGVLSAVPWLLFAITMYSAGFLSDRLVEKFPTVYVRKIMLSLAYVVIIVAILLVVLSPVQYRAAIIVGIILAIGAAGPAWASFGVNHLDIGGHYAGILMGLSNCLGSTPGFLVPIIIGYTVPNKHSQTEWDGAFMIIVLVCIAVLMFYTFFAAGELQPWARVNDDEYQPVLDSDTLPRDMSERSALNETNIDELTDRLRAEIQEEGHVQ